MHIVSSLIIQYKLARLQIVIEVCNHRVAGLQKFMKARNHLSFISLDTTKGNGYLILGCFEMHVEGESTLHPLFRVFQFNPF